MIISILDAFFAQYCYINIGAESECDNLFLPHRTSSQNKLHNLSFTQAINKTL
jgi:hypothetical protein